MEPSRRREPPPPPPFYRSIFSEIEEVGWEHLIRSEEDLSSLSFRILDKKGRAHSLEITLPRDYPEGAPSIAAVGWFLVFADFDSFFSSFLLMTSWCEMELSNSNTGWEETCLNNRPSFKPQ